jgi:hypothetical protein
VVTDDGVSVLRGRGDGTLAPPVVSHVEVGGEVVRGAAMGDLNSDGSPDLVASYGAPPSGGAPTKAELYDNTAVVLLNEGDGTFRAGAHYTTNGGIGLADVNRDGRPDLLVSRTSHMGPVTASVSVMLGNGDGTFQKPGPAHPACLEPSTLVDLNRDGTPDRVSANGYHQVCVTLGDGDGGFAAPTFYPAPGFGGARAGSPPDDVTSADFNGDGRPDLATTSYPRADVLVALNTTGSPQPPTQTSPTPPASPKAAAKATTHKTRLRHGRLIRLRVRCSTAVKYCTGKVKLRTKAKLHGRRRTLGTHSFIAPGGKKRTTHVRLIRHKARLVRRYARHHRWLNVKVEVISRNPHGAASYRTSNLLIKLRHGHRRHHR